jgi:hypothetical protein
MAYAYKTNVENEVVELHQLEVAIFWDIAPCSSKVMAPSSNEYLYFIFTRTGVTF